MCDFALCIKGFKAQNHMQSLAMPRNYWYTCHTQPDTRARQWQTERESRKKAGIPEEKEYESDCEDMLDPDQKMFCRLLEHHNNLRKESLAKFKESRRNAYVAGQGGAGEPPYKKYKIGGPVMDVSKEGEEKRMISANKVTFPKGAPKGSAGSALADMGTESKRQAARMADWEQTNKWKNSATASGSSSNAPPQKNQGKNQGKTGEISKANCQNGIVF